MTKNYLAHRAEDGREQTILDHLNGTAKLCARFASAFGAEDQGQLAGLAHDLGKYSEGFQRRLAGSSEKVDHATAGAFECVTRNQPLAAFTVAGHHTGLPDGGAQTNSPEEGTFLARMNKAAQGKLPPYDRWAAELSLPQLPQPDLGSSPAETMFFIRMLYSCLVDADFLDTETFMAGAPIPRGGGDTVEILESRLTGYLQTKFFSGAPRNKLNEQRNAILQRCFTQGEQQAPGLFSLTVPTGGGKTISSLAFALHHAKTHDLQRVVYVLPYTSIIEQNAEVFREILGTSNILEHHSGVLYDISEQADPQTIRMAKSTENWDMPIVVTTAVQFFESLFADRSSKCRKLHNLAGSVIIFDEAQMLPIPFLRPCVFSIAQLVKRYRVSAVLCTATQPVLGPIFREFLPETPSIELCPPETYQPEVFRRVTFRQSGTLPNDALAEQLNRLPQVLCIVGNRKGAQEIYRLLEPDGSFHLSTLMCPAHRKAVIAEIRERLRDGRPCRVVSTSLIEAGVDVDFPEVFREKAGLDSILQAAGRCNREGKRPAEKSEVIIFSGENRIPPLFKRNIAAANVALKVGAPDSPKAMETYFSELLDLEGKEGQDTKGILPLMQDIEHHFMPFPEVAKRFRLIEEDTRTVYIPWGESSDLFTRLEDGERSRGLFRKLGQYSVSVYSNHFKALNDAGVLLLLEDDSAILNDTSLYSDTTGLTLEVESGKALIL